MVPHETAHKAVYTVTTKDHVACFSAAIAQRDLDTAHQLLHFSSRTPGSDPGLIWEAIVQDLKKLSPLKEKNIFSVTANFLVSISACTVDIRGAKVWS